ncbi:MAG: DUF2283 domain-containing protein [Nanoarchaeota archaeon]|nr:DUF2283 domain-containing protein [Nanoarchaeota archaeon]
MNNKRHLDGTGKGEFLYDYKNDILVFKVKDRDYKMSIEFENFVIDLDTEEYVTGIRILDASKVSGLNKIIFTSLVHGEFNASIKENIITVRLKFVGKLRNRIIPIFSKEKEFTQQISAQGNPKHPIQDSIVTVPEIVAAH